MPSSCSCFSFTALLHDMHTLLLCLHSWSEVQEKHRKTRMYCCGQVQTQQRFGPWPAWQQGYQQGYQPWPPCRYGPPMMVPVPGVLQAFVGNALPPPRPPPGNPLSSQRVTQKNQTREVTARKANPEMQQGKQELARTNLQSTSTPHRNRPEESGSLASSTPGTVMLSSPFLLRISLYSGRRAAC